jgi:hypothetical protein
LTEKISWRHGVDETAGRRVDGSGVDRFLYFQTGATKRNFRSIHVLSIFGRKAVSAGQDPRDIGELTCNQTAGNCRAMVRAGKNSLPAILLARWSGAAA